MTVAGGTQGGGGSGLGASCGSSSSSSRGGGGGSGGCGALVPGFSRSFSLLLLRCLLPPPTARPPARLSPPPPPFHGEPMSPAVARSLARDDDSREEDLFSFLQAGQRGGGGGGGGGSGGVGVPQRRLRSSLGEPGPAVWLRGEAATSCFPAPPLMLLSGRRNSQWDRSPSSAFTPLTAGVRSPHLRMGAPLTVKMRAHGCL